MYKRQVVESPEGGIDIYSEADPQSTKLNGELIPNGIAIRIQGEKTGTDNKKWGYTQYHGMNGYVPMDNLDPCLLYTSSFAAFSAACAAGRMES